MMKSKIMRPDLEKSALTLGGNSGGNSGLILCRTVYSFFGSLTYHTQISVE